MTIASDGSTTTGQEQPARRFISTKLISGLIASLIVLFFSGVLIWHLVKEFRAEHVMASLRALSFASLGFALLFSALAYLAMTTYDALGFLWVGRARAGNLPYRKIALACFCGYAVSNTLGFASVTGTAVRLRLYSAWGVRLADALHVIAFSATTTWFGLCVLGGAGLALDPRGFNSNIPAGTEYLWRLTGFLLLSLPLVYIALCARWGGSSIQIKGREVALPTVGLAAAQVVAATIDWILGGLVLYVLLPDAPVSFFQYIASFVAAQGAGIASHVPGGAAVFDATLMILLKAAGYPGPAVLAALIGFRVAYYLVPFAIACILLAGREMIAHGGHLFGRSGAGKP